MATYTGDPNTPIDPNSAYAKSLNYIMPGGGPSSGATAYPINPPPSGYNPIYGGVPGPIGVPNPFQDLSSVIPGLGGLNANVSADLLSELGGQVSPATQALLQDKAAQYGVSSGMPQSGLSRSRNLRDLGLTSEAVQAQGLNDYSKLLQTISKTQTVDPNLQAEIAARNATLAAAPIPAQSHTYAQDLFNRYLQNMRGPGGGSGGFLGPAGGTQGPPDKTGPFVGGTPSPSPFTPGYQPGQGGLGVEPVSMADDWNSYWQNLAFGGSPGTGTSMQDDYWASLGGDLGNQDFYTEDLGFGG